MFWNITRFYFVTGSNSIPYFTLRRRMCERERPSLDNHCLPLSTDLNLHQTFSRVKNLTFPANVNMPVSESQLNMSNLKVMTQLS